MICGAAIILGTIAVIAVRYYQSLFGKEGYLTQTLPVSKGSLLSSRLLVALFWLICSAVLLLLCIFVGLYLVQPGNPIDLIRSIFAYLAVPEMSLFMIFAGVSIVTQTLLLIASIYFSVTLAHTRPFLKNNLLFSVVLYFGLNTCLSLLKLVAMLCIPVVLTVQNGHVALEFRFMFQSFMEMTQAGSANSVANLSIGNMILDVIGIAVLLPMSCWLLKNKTSVK